LARDERGSDEVLLTERDVEPVGVEISPQPEPRRLRMINTNQAVCRADARSNLGRILDPLPGKDFQTSTYPVEKQQTSCEALLTIDHLEMPESRTVIGDRGLSCTVTQQNATQDQGASIMAAVRPQQVEVLP